jgi:uncharacterized protein YndB with AHSA1/START domain
MLSPLIAAGLCLLGPADLAPTADEDVVRVLVWNAWRGGNEVDQGPEKVLAVIREARPDLVLMQESYDIDGERPTLGRWIAGELGWSAHQGESPHLCVLSPSDYGATFFHHPWHGVGVQISDDLGRSFQAWSIWLDWRANVANRLRDEPEISDEALIALESGESDRLPQAHALLEAVNATAIGAEGMPILVGGDFNTPSHLDWTEDTERIFRFRRALNLPVSRTMHAAGFFDAFRWVHPNPVHAPGITWTPLFRGAGADKPATFDRIDRLYVRNPLYRTSWSLHPFHAETLPRVWEDDSISASERTFPSDHGAVVIDLRWKRGADPVQVRTEHSISLETTIEASPTEVWAALTDLSQVQEWFFPEIGALEPRIGFEHQFAVEVGGQSINHSLLVRQVVQDRRLVLHWGYPDHVPGRADVSWDLSAEGGSTRVRFHQRPDAFFFFYQSGDGLFSRKAAVAGWNHFLDALKQHVEESAK